MSSLEGTQKTFNELVALKDKLKSTLTPEELTTMGMTIEVIQKYLTYLRGKAIEARTATGGGRRRSRRHTKKNRKSRRHRK